jgi:phosphohistidine phosphatase
LPETIACSPAKRAVQTLELLDLGVEHIVFEERIYSASIGAMLDIVQSLDDGCRSAMLVGHNPTMTQLVGWLSGANIGNMPTCSVATIELASKHWKDAGTCAAQLLDFDYPRKMG